METLNDVRCQRHGFEIAENSCRNCGHDFCNECLVYAFGPKKPPYCVSCALAASGVRANAGNTPAMSRRDIRKREKARRKARKADQVAAASGAPEIDWSVPEGSSPAFDWADQMDEGAPSGRVVSF